MSAFGTTLNILNIIRWVITNILFFGLLIWLIYAMATSSSSVGLPERFILQLNPEGIVVEQHTGSAADRALNLAAGYNVDPEVRLRDLLLVIEQAKTDDRVAGMMLDLQDFWSAGPAQLQELGAALNRFKESGKPMLAYGMWFEQDSYYLAAHADEVILAEGGTVWLEGFAVYQNYFAEALKSLKVNIHVFKAGEFKSAVEPYLRNTMSKSARQANQALVDDLWDGFGKDLAAQRDVAITDLDSYINTFTKQVQAADGDASQPAVSANLVNVAAHEQYAHCLANASTVQAADIARAECDVLLEEEPDLKQIVALQHKIEAVPQVPFLEYLASLEIERGLATLAEDKVGVIVASGVIVAGEQPTGMIGSDSLIRLIEKAREDESLDAVVLRIDSPGGDALASDEILQELDQLAAVKPLIVSMGTVAASGGYWIALAGDAIYAEPTTVTGSIGVFAMFPTLEDSLKELGIHSDGVGSHKVSGGIALDRTLNPKIAAAMNSMIKFSYQGFLELVGERRDMEVDAVDKVAQGRVWTGNQALNNGLIDELGGLHDALQAAAGAADLDGFSIEYVEAEPTFFDQIAMSMAQSESNTAKTLAGNTFKLPRSYHLQQANQLSNMLTTFAQDPAIQSVMTLLQSKQPIMAHCLCGSPSSRPSRSKYAQ